MSERGSILIGTLFLAVMVSLSLGSLMYQVDSARQASLRATIRTNADFTQATLQMVLTKSAHCAANLVTGAFGATLAELQSKAAAGTTQVLLPNPVPAGPPVVVAPNTTFGRFQVTKLSFGTVTQLFPPDLSYTADLIVDIIPFGTTIARQIYIPFYFETDAAGVLVGCTASVRSDSQKSITVETELCNHWEGPTFDFRYIGRYCSAGTP